MLESVRIHAPWKITDAPRLRTTGLYRSSVILFNLHCVHGITKNSSKEIEKCIHVFILSKRLAQHKRTYKKTFFNIKNFQVLEPE